MAYVTEVSVPLAAGWSVRRCERGTGVICRVTMKKPGQADSIVRIDVSKPMFLDPLPVALAARSAAFAEQVADSLEREAGSPADVREYVVVLAGAAAASETVAAYPVALSETRAAASIGEPLPASVPSARKPTRTRER